MLISPFAFKPDAKAAQDYPVGGIVRRFGFLGGQTTVWIEYNEALVETETRTFVVYPDGKARDKGLCVYVGSEFDTGGQLWHCHEIPS